MKKIVTLIVLAAIAISGSAFAQSGWEDNMGVYFDADATITTNNDGAPGAHHVYLVMSELTGSSVEGFEAKITATGGLIISYTSLVFPVDTINVGSRYGEIIAGFATPVIPVDGKVVAMEFDVIITDPAIPGLLFIDPVYFPSIAGGPAYLSGGEIVAAHNSTAPGMPVLSTNGTEDPVATDGTSFDNLKSLYR